MPFVAATNDPADEQFANALTENLWTLMGKSSVLKVTSGRSVLSYKGKVIDARTLGRELNVRYLVDGEIRSTENNVAITTRLVDSETGKSVWSDRLDTHAGISDERLVILAKKLRELLGDAIYEDELRRAVANPAAASAANLSLNGDAALRQAAGSLEKLKVVRKFYDDALRIDPNYVPAINGLATVIGHFQEADLDADAATTERWLNKLDKLTSRAVTLNEGSIGVWYRRADALAALGRPDQALAANAKGRSLSDSEDLGLVGQQGFILLSLDRPEEALALGQSMMTLTPQNNTGQEGFASRLMCNTYLALGRYKEAAVWCEKAAARDDWWIDQVFLTATYTQLGDSAKASLAKADLLKKKPGFTIEKWRPIDSTARNSAYEHQLETTLYEGLRRAGIPEEVAPPD